MSDAFESGQLSITRLCLPAPEYSDLTFPRYRSHLEGNGDPVAIGLRWNGEPAGLALASIDSNRGTAALLSIAVAERWRGQGLGTALLKRLESEAGPGCSTMEAVFTEATASFPIVKRMLEGQGWAPATPRMLVCRTDIVAIRKPAWMRKPLLPPAFTIFPWCELTEGQKNAIREKREIGYPAVLSPFLCGDSFEPVTSLGLRYEGRVAGWIITHLAMPDTLRVSSLYVRPDLQKRARAVALLAESMARYEAHPLSRVAPNGIFAVHVGNIQMMEFVRRRMSTCVTSSYYSYYSSKALSGARPAGAEDSCTSLCMSTPA